jgi:hypothetical protein
MRTHFRSPARVCALFSFFFQGFFNIPLSRYSVGMLTLFVSVVVVKAARSSFFLFTDIAAA